MKKGMMTTIHHFMINIKMIDYFVSDVNEKLICNGIIKTLSDVVVDHLIYDKYQADVDDTLKFYIYDDGNIINDKIFDTSFLSMGCYHRSTYWHISTNSDDDDMPIYDNEA